MPMILGARPGPPHRCPRGAARRPRQGERVVTPRRTLVSAKAWVWGAGPRWP